MTAALHPEQVESDSTRVQPCTVDQMAREAGVSRRLMFLALKAHRGGCAELHGMMRDGSLTANLGAVLVDLFPHHDDQRVVLAEFATLPQRQWLGFARRVAALMAEETTPKTGPLNPPEIGVVSIPPKTGGFEINGLTGTPSDVQRLDNGCAQLLVDAKASTQASTRDADGKVRIAGVRE